MDLEDKTIESRCTRTAALRRRRAAAWLVAAMVVGAMPALGAQTFRGKRLFFGDAHWHSCLSQDAPRETSLDDQYQSMLVDYGLDFSLESEHAEGAEAGISTCLPYLPTVMAPAGGPPLPYTGEAIASAMKDAADAWNGQQRVTPTGTISFVTFPGYEWAPDARCWMARSESLLPPDTNASNNTPGHINYFFDGTSGWTYHDDVWEPGDGDSTTCAVATGLGLTYYNGSKDWIDEILGQLIHQRDDPDRPYDLMIQYNHPAASYDKGGESDHLAKWNDFEHNLDQCSIRGGGASCSESHCEALRRAYGVTSVEWYASHEAALGSTELDGTEGPACTGNETLPEFMSPHCFHDTFHLPSLYVTSRGLREGYMLSETGGSDSHSGRRFAPDGFPGGRGAGSKSLTVVQASAATRPAIWDGLTRRRTYALSRLREIGPVHKGRVDFFTPDPIGNQEASAALLPGDPRPSDPEFGMGELVAVAAAGGARSFTISAAAEEGTTGVYPVELRLYRVAADTPLSDETQIPFRWLDDVPGDPGKFGQLLGTFVNTTGSPTLTHTFTNVVVRPGDAVFAVVPYSDYVWVDDFYDSNRQPLDADRNGVPDPGKFGYLHNNDNTWARTTPIFFHAADERPQATAGCGHVVTFNGSGSGSPMANGSLDAGITGDSGVLPVAIPGGYDREWNRWRFSLPTNYEFVDLSFFTQRDEDNVGHLFAVRIDGQLVYSGRAGIDHAADALVEKRGIPFALKKGLHQLEVHVDDQEYANGDNDPDFHCNDYDGPAAFLDAVAFHHTPTGECLDAGPPTITCPTSISLECSAPGGAPASDLALQFFLASASATDDHDTSPTIANDAPAVFPTGTTTVTFTAIDDAWNYSTCSASVTVGDTHPPQLAAFALSPAKLTRANRKLVPIAVPTLVATDACDPAPRISCRVASNEPPKKFDIVFDGEPIKAQSTGERLIETTAGQGTFMLQLRADRSKKGEGRTYTTSCVAVDAAGNQSTTRTATVEVPR